MHLSKISSVVAASSPGLAANYCTLWADFLWAEKVRQLNLVLGSPPTDIEWYPPYLQRNHGAVIVPDRCQDMPVVLWLCLGPSDCDRNKDLWDEAMYDKGAQPLREESQRSMRRYGPYMPAS